MLQVVIVANIFVLYF